MLEKWNIMQSICDFRLQVKNFFFNLKIFRLFKINSKKVDDNFTNMSYKNFLHDLYHFSDFLEETFYIRN